MMLNVLEDYLDSHKYEHCRIDGNVTGPKRQAAIDRFQGKKVRLCEERSESQRRSRS